MKVELHSEVPDRPLGLRLAALVKDASLMDIAVAFVTKHGADAIQAIIDHLDGHAEIRLLVSILFPTDIKAIAKLANQINVRVHLGYNNEAERLHWQFHSKILFVERQDKSRTIVIGSHNWTQNGLDGGNLEASVILECSETDPIVEQTREHIRRCRQLPACQDFDESRMDFYIAIQREFHPKLRRKNLPFRGFDKLDAIAILAEDWTDGLSKAGDIYVRFPVQEPGVIDTGRTIWLFVFKRDSLLGCRYPIPIPMRLVGKVTGKDEYPDRFQSRESSSYLIEDINQPRVRTLHEFPPLSGGDMWVAFAYSHVSGPESLPLFHAGDAAPSAALSLEPRAESEADECGIASTQFKLDRPESERMVPANLIAKVLLDVPFQFAYPPNWRTSIEELLAREANARTGPPYVVDPRYVEGITAYVCSVQFKSDSVLMNAIYNQMNNSNT